MVNQVSGLFVVAMYSTSTGCIKTKTASGFGPGGLLIFDYLGRNSDQ